MIHCIKCVPKLYFILPVLHAAVLQKSKLSQTDTRKTIFLGQRRRSRLGPNHVTTQCRDQASGLGSGPVTSLEQIFLKLDALTLRRCLVTRLSRDRSRGSSRRCLARRWRHHTVVSWRREARRQIQHDTRRSSLRICTRRRRKQDKHTETNLRRWQNIRVGWRRRRRRRWWNCSLILVCAVKLQVQN